MDRWITADVLKMLQSEQTTAHRIYSSPQAWVERFGPDILISYKSAAARDAVIDQLSTWARDCGCEYERVFGRHLPKQNAGRTAPELIRGDPQRSLRTVVAERGLQFALDFGAGYSAGLFVDQRANRSYVRRAKPERLLNCFAYTCTFSVAAAMEGAETTSIDLSKKSLDRGRENFGLNALDIGRHRFLADDVLDVLPRFARRGDAFDMIILDPPTFSRGNKGRKFQVERDLEPLLLAALEVAARNAKILLSTNCSRLNRATLESIARFCLKSARRGATYHREPALPDIPAEFSAQTLWLLLK
jgi:23S rRNA (cytosine1962-C5)-methyltransferase